MSIITCDDHFTCLLEVITDHPDDITKYADKQALFSCWATDVESFHWRVNGTDTESDSLTSQIKADLIKESSKHGVVHISTLSVTARINYNGTRVQCTVEGMGRLLLSETATLTIQGNICSGPSFDT